MDRFAGFVHRFDLFLETCRGDCCAEFSIGIDVNGNAATGGFPTDSRDKGGRLSFFLADADGVGLGRNTNIADVDVIIARGEISTGSCAQGDIEAAGVVKERLQTVGRVEAAGCVFIERKSTVGRIALADSVTKERKSTVGRVVSAVCVALERRATVGGVDDASCVVLERRVTVGGVVDADCVVPERIETVGCVVVAGCVVQERLNTIGRVLNAGCVAKERLKAIGRIAVAGAVLIERKSTVGRVGDPGGEAEKRILTLSRIEARIASVRCWSTPKAFGVGERAKQTSTVRSPATAVLIEFRLRGVIVLN